jgi:hypothetical protein
MFRSALPTIATCLFATTVFAQRPTATLVSNSLVRLDLDGFRLFADAPDAASSKAIAVDDIVLYATEPSSPVPGGRTFMPSMEGELLERRTERLGEKTAIYVHPTSTPYQDAPHSSYLVQWNGRRIWFSGLTEDPTALLAATDIDLAFVGPGLVKAIEKAGRSISARTVVVYHLPEGDGRGEMSVPCDRCKVVLPIPGEVIQLFR